MENKQNLNINDNYTNYTNLSEFRVNVEAEMAELDRLFSDSPTNPSPTPNTVPSSPSLEINDSYTNFTDLSEFRVNVEAEMAEIDRLFGDEPSIPQAKPTIPTSGEISQNSNSNNSNSTPTLINHYPNNLDLKDFTNLMMNLQKEINSLSTNLSRIEKISVTVKSPENDPTKGAQKTDELLRITKMLFEKLNHIEHLLSTRS